MNAQRIEDSHGSVFREKMYRSMEQPAGTRQAGYWGRKDPYIEVMNIIGVSACIVAFVCFATLAVYWLAK